MSAEDIWNEWQDYLEQDRADSDEEQRELGEYEPELDETLAYEENELDETLAYEENNDGMAQAAQVDIAALLAQLTQANIDRNVRDVAADGRAAAAAINRTQEDLIRIQVSKVDRCSGDDKVKLRRWIRDLTALNANHPGTTVAVAERTSRENLSDTVKAFLGDVANAPRANITWVALGDNIELLLLGEAYEEVLRSEHRIITQKTHETTGDYSERYLNSAKNAYSEPWDVVTNQSLIALFAGGLIDRRMARDVGVVLRKPTLRETLNQARAYAGIEASMDLRETRREDIAAAAGARRSRRYEGCREQHDTGTAEK